MIFARNVFFVVLVGSAASGCAADKMQHGAVGVGIAGAGVAAGADWRVSCFAAAAAGAAKEARDAQGHGDVEAMDFVATALPGCVLSYLFEAFRE